MASAKRLKVSKEPILIAHRYIVVIYTKLKRARYVYCMNLKDVKAKRDAAPKGSVIEVFKAMHEHKETWVK